MKQVLCTLLSASLEKQARRSFYDIAGTKSLHRKFKPWTTAAAKTMTAIFKKEHDFIDLDFIFVEESDSNPLVGDASVWACEKLACMGKRIAGQFPYYQLSQWPLSMSMFGVSLWIMFGATLPPLGLTSARLHPPELGIKRNQTLPPRF